MIRKALLDLRARAARRCGVFRLMALAPPALVHLWLTGAAAVPALLVAVSVALGWSFLFAELRGRGPLLAGLVPALLLVLFAPPEAALWQLALALSLALVMGELIFGGAGFGFLSTGALALAFLTFSFPGLALGMPGPMVLWAALPGGGLLLLSGLAPWRVVLAGGTAFAGLAALFWSLSPGLIGPVLFVLVFLAADPFAAPVSGPGHWVHGGLAG
ncbi:RnfABCDGE type electron transport complex subunit D, partial [Limimaricola sp. ASW11-118]